MSSLEVLFFAENTEYFFLQFTIESFNYSLQAIFFVSIFEYYAITRYYVHDAKIQSTLNVANRANRL